MSWLREANAEPIAGYRLIEPLGSGGFGEAWKCEAPGGIYKAIKFVFGNLNSLDVDAARAEQELKALNRVKEVRHPFVLSMDRIEIVEGELVIVMELADKNLYDAYQESKDAGLIGIPRDDMLRYIRDSAEALDYMCEKHGLQHLDIKPRNLFLVGDRVKVADFGLVKHLERSGASGILGGVTPLYASPEAFAGNISNKSDQYSLAIVYQELLTSQRPFHGKNAREVAQKHMSSEPDLRSLPESERAIVRRALSKNPEDRFPNCLAFVRALFNSQYPAQLPSTHPHHQDDSPAPTKSLNNSLEEFILIGDAKPQENKNNNPPEQAQPPVIPSHLLEEEPDWGSDDMVALGEVPDFDAEGDQFHGLLEEWSAAADQGAGVYSDLGVTACQPQTGALRPTLLIGVGGVGRRVLLEMRCRFLDRFGDLNRAPAFRYLYIEPDADAIKGAMKGSPEIALAASEIYHLSLQPMSHYRRKQLDQLYEWLTREKLYSIPRSLKTQGSRALGRLAFSDHYLRLITRLKREIREMTDPDALYRAVSETGLALRDAVPRIIVVGSACGGGSGFFLDLGYSLRRLLSQMNQQKAQLLAFLHCGSPRDPATPPPELANLYATLTEWNHFSEDITSFNAEYGSEGPRLVESGKAYDATYLASQKERSPEARREVVAHLGSYLFHELTTPIGHKLDPSRGGVELGESATSFRSFGTHDVWFPRGLMLRIAARRVVKGLFEEWVQVPGQEQLKEQIHNPGDSRFSLLQDSAGTQKPSLTEPEPSFDAYLTSDELDAACSRIFVEPTMRSDKLKAALEEKTCEYLEGKTPEQALRDLLGKLEEQCWEYGAPDDAGSWAEQAVERVRQWLGGGVQGEGHALTSVGHTRSRLTRALESAADSLAKEQTEFLNSAANEVMGIAGPRIAHGEFALRKIIEWCDQEADALKLAQESQREKTSEASKKLEEALERCLNGGGGFGWLMGRRQRPLRALLDHLAAFARQCVADDVNAALEQFFHRLKGRLEDRLQDLSWCRSRLRQLKEALEMSPEMAATLFDNGSEGSASRDDLTNSSKPIVSTEAYWEKLQCSKATRVVLPDGQKDLEQAAEIFVDTLTPEHWNWVDQLIHEQVLEIRGGLYSASMNPRDILRDFVSPLIEQTAKGLSQYLPITDVAQVELSLCEDMGNRDEALGNRLEETFEAAIPLLDTWEMNQEGVPSSNTDSDADQDQVTEQTYLLIPGSDSGVTYGTEARTTLDNIELVRSPGQTEMVLIREKSGMTPVEMRSLLTACRQAYQGNLHTPATSPHARFDIQDWIPLEP